ncbi:MAG: tRNA-dihydrouridine synthase family protein, partial [bacterium]|nr:tRNA-dihydrouridine synthase family protein [bacterium]
MPLGFWSKLKKPIFAMAPLANVTDVVFREIIARHGKPDVFYTEFVSADGLCSKGREILLRDLKYTENQRPIVAQFFTSRPENMFKAASLARELGFDGVDINMGCPDRSVVKQGAGAALIKNPVLAKEIIVAAKEGARFPRQGSGQARQADLPVSVKTRIGFNKIEIDTWIPALLETGIAAVAVHLRTVKEMSKVPSHWETLKQIVEIRSALKKDTLIIGNGDAMTLED